MQIKQYWLFDNVTRIVNQNALIAQVRAGLSHIPRNSLLNKPLIEKTGFAVIAKDDFSGTEYIADFRNQTIYNTANAAESKAIIELGDIESGWTLQQPLPFSIWESDQWVQQLTLLQKAKVTEVSVWRNHEESRLDKVMVNNLNWDADIPSRVRIESILQSEFTPPFWTDANNVDQPVTREQLKTIITTIAELGFNIHARQREMKAELASLTSCEAVNNYMIGWPA